MTDITEIVDINTFSNFHCSLCNCLLSTPPVFINVHGKNICGRCKSDHTVGLRLHNIYYETLAHQFQFPCRFNNEGCKVKKIFSEMKHHEETCPYQSKKCGVKMCQWSGIPTELILHYNKHHKELVIENNCLVKELLEDAGTFMFVTKGFYFFIEWCYSAFKFTLSLHNLYLLDLNCDFTVNYNLSTMDVERSGSLKFNNSGILILEDIEKAYIPVLISLEILLSEDAVHKKAETLNNITCPNCSCMMIPPILECPVGHLTCVDCSDDDYDFCRKCDEDELKFKRMPELEMLAASLLYKCKWKDCGENFSIRDIEDHQRTCSNRLYICPHCSPWKGLLNEISTHISVCTSEDYICPVFTDTEITIQATVNDEQEYTLIAHNEQFYVIFKPRCNEGIEVAVCNIGPPSLFGWYSYEVVLHHGENINFPFNKTYIINTKGSKRYTFMIPDSDIDKFSGNEFGKITIKIKLLSGSEKTKNVNKFFVWFR